LQTPPTNKINLNSSANGFVDSAGKVQSSISPNSQLSSFSNIDLSDGKVKSP